MSHQCQQCSATFTLKHNLNRHKRTACKNVINQENTGPNVSETGPNVSETGPNVSESSTNVSEIGPNVSNDTSVGRNVTPDVNTIKFEKVDADHVKCLSCSKVVTKRRKNEHAKACRGDLHVLQCKFCGCMCGNRLQKSRHQQKCDQNPSTINNIHNDHSVTNNIGNVDNSVNDNSVNDNSVTNNNVTVNNNLILNVYGKENHDSLIETIQKLYPQAFINMVEEGDAASLMKLIHFNKDYPENQTVRKTNKKDVSAEVHVGDGKWEARPSKQVIDTFRSETSQRVCDPLTKPGTHSKHILSKTRNQTDRFLEETMYRQGGGTAEDASSSTTESVLKPYAMDERQQADRDFLRRLTKLRDELLKEYGSCDTPLLRNSVIGLFKKESADMMTEYKERWGSVFSINYKTLFP